MTNDLSSTGQLSRSRHAILYYKYTHEDIVNYMRLVVQVLSEHEEALDRAKVYGYQDGYREGHDDGMKVGRRQSAVKLQ